jgi:transcriptional regulator with XRE-family HTH domain
MKPAADLLRDARKHAGVTQAELAERLGVAQPTVARLESRRANPTVATLQRMLAALGQELVIDVCARTAPEVDETLIRRQLALSPGQRVEAFERAYRNVRAATGGVRGLG